MSTITEGLLAVLVVTFDEGTNPVVGVSGEFGDGVSVLVLVE